MFRNSSISKTVATVGDDTDDRLDAVDGHPSFPCILITVLIVARCVL